MQSVQIDAPDVPALPFGLLSVADVENVSDAHMLGGFEYLTQCGHGAGFSINPCTTLTASTTVGVAGTRPATVVVGSDVPGTYTIVWGDATADGTITITEGETSESLLHNYATTGNKTITVTGPLGYGVRTIVVNAGTLATLVNENPVTKAAIPAVVNVIGDPVTVLSKYRCTPVGVDQATRDKRAMSGLNRSDSWVHEKALLARVLGATGVLDLTGGTGTTAKRAVALLENYAAVTYAGTPIIHVDRFTGSLLADGGAVERHGNRLETTQGSRVASGAGYSSHPLPASSWAYVTGMVVIRRGTAMVHPGFTQDTNDAVTLAERTSVLAVECIVAKAQITTA